MKVSKMVKLLKGMNGFHDIRVDGFSSPSRRLAVANFDGDKKKVTLVTQGELDLYFDKICYGGVTVETFLNFLQELPKNTDVCCSSELVALSVKISEEYPGSVMIADASYGSMHDDLEEQFKRLEDEKINEEEFFNDLYETGYTLEDIRDCLHDKYLYAKKQMLKYGLVTEKYIAEIEYTLTAEGYERVKSALYDSLGKNIVDEDDIDTVTDGIISNLNLQVCVDYDGDYIGYFNVGGKDVMVSLSHGIDFIHTSDVEVMFDDLAYIPERYVLRYCPYCGDKKVIHVDGVTRCSCGNPMSFRGKKLEKNTLCDHEMLPDYIQEELMKKM